MTETHIGTNKQRNKIKQRKNKQNTKATKNKKINKVVRYQYLDGNESYSNSMKKDNSFEKRKNKFSHVEYINIRVRHFVAKKLCRIIHKPRS